MRRYLRDLLIVLMGILKRDRRGRVIYYHDLSRNYTTQGTPMDLFKAQMTALKEAGFRVVGCLPEQRNEVMVCFDDGWRGIWDEREYLIENKIIPTVFVVNNFIGKEGYLTLDEILELQQYGFRFQGHTYSHKSLTEVTGQELDHEMIEARDDLSEILHKNVDELCFPRGKYSDDLVKMAGENGYEKVYICAPGCYSPDDVIVHRNLVQEASPKVFKSVLRGGMDFLARHAERIHHL